MSKFTDDQVKQWMLTHREPDGDLPIQQAIRVGRKYGVPPHQVFRVADEIRGETMARQVSGFPSGVHDLLVYAYVGGRTPEEMDHILGTPKGAFRKWCVDHKYPLSSERHVPRDQAHTVASHLERGHDTVWEHAGLEIPAELRPENWQEQGHSTHGQKGVDFG